MLKNLNLLEFAEYFFLAATVGCTIATLFGEPVYYSLVPVSIALVLGAINRFRLEKQSQISKADLAAKIDSDREMLTQLIANLETAIDSFNFPESQESNNSNFSNKENIKNLITAIESLSNRLNIQEQTIKMLQTELELVSQQFKRRPELEQINNLTSIIVDLQQFINELPQWGSLQQKQLIETQEKINNALTQLSAELADIPHKVDAAVQTRVDEINQNR